MATHNVESEVTGSVWKVQVEVGDNVTEGDVILILESMKMEIPVESPADGTVAELESTARRGCYRRIKLSRSYKVRSTNRRKSHVRSRNHQR